MRVSQISIETFLITQVYVDWKFKKCFCFPQSLPPFQPELGSIVEEH